MRQTTTKLGALARTAMGVCALAACALAGCATPEPEPYQRPTEAGAPTSTWDADQTRAIDAVQKYVAVWSDISQNLETSDWSRIHKVAGDPAAQEAIDNWEDWLDAGLRFVGAPVVTIDSVTPGQADKKVREYHVGVCYDKTNAYLVRPDGARMVGRVADRSMGTYTVVVSYKGPDLVTKGKIGDGEC